MSAAISYHSIRNTVAINSINMHNNGCDIVKYTMVFLFSDLLYFLSHGINTIMQCFRVVYDEISRGSLACFWCAHGKIHVKTGILHAFLRARVA